MGGRYIFNGKLTLLCQIAPRIASSLPALSSFEPEAELGRLFLVPNCFSVIQLPTIHDRKSARVVY